jgi:hypothetical protein
VVTKEIGRAHKKGNMDARSMSLLQRVARIHVRARKYKKNKSRCMFGTSAIFTTSTCAAKRLPELGL